MPDTEILHLIPAALRKTIHLHQALVKGHAEAAEKARAEGTEPPAAPPPLRIDAKSFGFMSGRLVQLRVLGLDEIMAAEKVARRRITEDMTGMDFDALCQQERLTRIVIGVSDPHIDPREKDPATNPRATVRPVTQADLEGVSLTPGADGTGKPTNRRLGDLFAPKDLDILRAWDRRHHSTSLQDIEDVLGNAMPTAED